MPTTQAQIRDLAVIGDQRTAALLTRHGEIVWFCPDRFDRPSLLARLLDPAGGSWAIERHGAVPNGREYMGPSAILQTRLGSPDGEIRLLDWMTMGQTAPQGAICRTLSAAPGDCAMIFSPAPDYARSTPCLVATHDGVTIQRDHTLFGSHALVIVGDGVRMAVPAGQDSWAVLVPVGTRRPDARMIDGWRASTMQAWSELAAHDAPAGPYAAQVAACLRALRLMTHRPSGGIIAAVSTSLPEVAGGQRNYDYRYVWLRDAGMIASALTRSGGGGDQARHFLDFIGASTARADDIFLPPALSLDGGLVPEETPLPHLAGYDGGRPVVIGNGARTQLQLDALGNVLVVAKLLYNLTPERPHLAMISQLADFLCEHWREPDYGLWEEQQRAQYTSSKVIVACGLEFIAPHGTAAQGVRWRGAARDIRTYINRNCLTPSGAYAAIAGGCAVDVSAALFPVWAFCDADSPEMGVTMVELQRDLAEGDLYRRRLELFPSEKEGVFLAGTFWVAQYWILRGEMDRAQRIIDAAMMFSNDLGFFAEEGTPSSGMMVGNFPQSFAHAAMLGTIFDFTNAQQSKACATAEHAI